MAVASGVEEIGTGRAVTHRSRFPFGSVTKPLIATVVMQLVADGDIDLDIPVRRYLTEPRATSWGDATVRQLLSHSGGLVAGYEVQGRVVSPRRYVRNCAQEPLVAPPGTAFSYSNTGYVVLGHLIETVAGYDWHEAVEAFLAKPLNLGLAYMDGQLGWSSVRAHAVSGDSVVLLDVELPAGWGPAGGIAGTASDLAVLARLFLDGSPSEVLDAQAAAEMCTAVPGLEPLGLAEGWGLGLAVYGEGWFGHDGTLDGSSAHLRFHPETGTIVALTTNASSGTALWEDLWGRIGPATEPIPLKRHLMPDPLAYVADDYRNGDVRFEVHRGGLGELRLRDGTGFSATLLPAGEDVFLVHRSDVTSPTQPCRFVRDGAGRVTGLQFSGRLAVRETIGRTEERYASR